jgi:hypothetical protein
MHVERQRFERAVSRTGGGTGARCSPGRNWKCSSIPNVNASVRQARVLPCFPVLVSRQHRAHASATAGSGDTCFRRVNLVYKAPCVRRS